MPKKEINIIDNKDPDVIIEYLFVEKELNLSSTMKTNQGFFDGYINLYFTGQLKNNDLPTFIKIFHKEFEQRAKELKYFINKKIDLSDCKFGIVDENKNIKVFNAINDSFLKALIQCPKFIIVGKEFDLDKFKTHKIFDDFFKFVYGIFDKEKIMDNYMEPDATVEYLFIEKADRQIKVINDDQGYVMAFINIFFTGEYANNTLTAFRNLLEEELNLSLQDLYYPSIKSINFDDYKFYLVDNDKNTMEFDKIDEKFFGELMASLRNLVIIGKNFDFESFKDHDIFLEWFDKYSNKI